MTKLEFDDEGLRLVEEFNASAGARARRARILEVLALKPGDHVLDVGKERCAAQGQLDTLIQSSYFRSKGTTSYEVDQCQRAQKSHG